MTELDGLRNTDRNPIRPQHPVRQNHGNNFPRREKRFLSRMQRPHLVNRRRNPNQYRRPNKRKRPENSLRRIELLQQYETYKRDNRFRCETNENDP